VADRNLRLAGTPGSDQAAGGIVGEPGQEQQAAIGRPGRLGLAGIKAQRHVGELLPVTSGEIQQPQVEGLVGAAVGGVKATLTSRPSGCASIKPMTWSLSVLGQRSRWLTPLRRSVRAISLPGSTVLNTTSPPATPSTTWGSRRKAPSAVANAL
jgi:hypothetical protein